MPDAETQFTTHSMKAPRRLLMPGIVLGLRDRTPWRTTDEKDVAKEKQNP
jgi:hypothetical protein